MDENFLSFFLLNLESEQKFYKTIFWILKSSSWVDAWFLSKGYDKSCTVEGFFCIRNNMWQKYSKEML